MDCSTNALLNGARCYQNCIPGGMMLPVLIALAVDISGENPDPNYLMGKAARYHSQLPAGAELPVLIALACDIANSTPSSSPLIPVMASDTAPSVYN